MAKIKYWKDEIELTSLIPIDLSRPKIYALANAAFNENHWTRSFLTENNEIVIARATQNKYLDHNVSLTIEAKNSLDTVEYEKIIEKMRYELGLDEKMKILQDMSKSDTKVRIAVNSNSGFRMFANSNAIEAAILTIISQNTSFFIYLELVEKFMKKYGIKVPWDKKIRVFPDKRQIASLLPQDWKKLKLGYKSKYLGALSEDELDKIETFAYYPVLKRGLEGLLKIKGIGQYTARLLLIYHSRRYDYAFFDTYVVEVLRHKYGIKNFNNIGDFDRWITNRWPNDPAIIVHSLLLDYLPIYLKSHKTFFSK